MSFKPWNFTYIPPPTLQPLAVAPGSLAQSSLAQAATGFSPASTVAGDLIQTFQNLIDTSNYLQQLIISNNQALSIAIDGQSDPVTAAALTQIYGSEVPFVTTQMFSNLLTAYFNAAQISISAGTSNVTANPMQVSNLIQSINAVTDALAQDASPAALQVAQLINLQGDATVFANIQNGLTQYPAYTNSSPGTDVSSALATSLTNAANTTQAIYASTFSLATLDRTAADAAQIVSTFATETGVELKQLASLIAVAQSMTIKKLAKTLLGGLVGFIMVKTVSELGPMAMVVDRLEQSALGPLAQFSGELNSLLNSVRSMLYSAKQFAGSVKTASNIVQNGAASGLSKNNMIVGSLPHNSGSYQSTKVSGVSKGLQLVGEGIDWVQKNTTGRFQEISTALNASFLRRSSYQSQLLDIMAIGQSITTVMSLIQAASNSNSVSGALSAAGAAAGVTANIVNVASTMPLNVQSTLMNGGATNITTTGTTNVQIASNKIS